MFLYPIYITLLFSTCLRIFRCQECREVFTNPHEFNTSRSAIHCFEYCFSSEARLGYTLFFLLLPIIFYLTEFLTLTDRWTNQKTTLLDFCFNRFEVTTLRKKLQKLTKDIKYHCCSPLKMLVSILHLIFWFLITVVTIIFWQPITALFKVNIFSLDSTTNALSI